MVDVLFLLLIAGFFGLAVLLVRGCERLLAGADQPAVVDVVGEPAGADAVEGAA